MLDAPWRSPHVFRPFPPPLGKAGQMRSFAAQAPCGAPGRASPLSLLPFVIGGLLGSASVSAAQNPPLPPPSQAQQALQEAVQQNPGLADVIRQRLLQSGLTPEQVRARLQADRKSTRLNSSHLVISYAVFCLKKKNKKGEAYIAH